MPRLKFGDLRCFGSSSLVQRRDPKWAWGQPLAPMQLQTHSAICAQQKRKFWKDLSTGARAAVEELGGSLRNKFKKKRPFLVLGNGPVPEGKRRAALRMVRNEEPVVVAINDHRAQSAFPRVAPHIVVVTEKTRRRDHVLRAAAAASATAFILCKDPRSRWRAKLWQPLAPMHSARLCDDALKRIARTASVTSGFMMLAILQLLWPTRRKYFLGFGGSGHAAAPRARMWEGLAAEHAVLAELLQREAMLCNLGVPLVPVSQPLARICPRCPRRRAGSVVTSGHGTLRCKRCGRRWTPGRAPPPGAGVPLLPLSQEGGEKWQLLQVQWLQMFFSRTGWRPAQAWAARVCIGRRRCVIMAVAGASPHFSAWLALRKTFEFASRKIQTNTSTRTHD